LEQIKVEEEFNSWFYQKGIYPSINSGWQLNRRFLKTDKKVTLPIFMI
jgi:hypothetical protein